MDTNKMRDQFEAYWTRQLWAECYEDVKEQMFTIWKASREAVAVELPSRPHASEEEQERMTDYEIGLGHGGCEEWDKIRDKIKAQGLKVKS